MNESFFLTPENWSFNAFSAWLFAKADFLKEKGSVVVIQRCDGPRSSLRLRVESVARLSELIVWNDGMAYEGVLDLHNGNFIYEQDGSQLVDDGSAQLSVFFELITSV